MAVRDNFNQLADQVIAERRWSEARELLENALADMPPKWKAAQEDGDFLKIAFWDESEFFAYVQHGQAEKSIKWIAGSYSKAWYQLATIAVEEQRFDSALICIESGLAVELDHPELWSEKGYILGRLQRHQEALDCYRRAATSRDWAPSSQVARALRGQGAALVDLERLDEAEALFLRSLELAPDSKVAKHELDYIKQLRNKRAEGKPMHLGSSIHLPTRRRIP